MDLSFLFRPHIRHNDISLTTLRFRARNALLILSSKRYARTRLRLLFRLLGQNFIVLGLGDRFVCSLAVCS